MNGRAPTSSRVCQLALALAMVMSPPAPASACSPSDITPWRYFGETGVGIKNYRRIVWAEVVALEAPARRRELQEWHAQVQRTAALQAESEARYARQKAEWVQRPDGPPMPPPESILEFETTPPPAFQLHGHATLEVTEVLHGDDATPVNIPIGGPCGSIPVLGERLLVFVRYDGGSAMFRRADTPPPQTPFLAISPEAEAAMRRCLTEQQCEGLHLIMR